MNYKFRLGDIIRPRPGFCNPGSYGNNGDYSHSEVVDKKTTTRGYAYVVKHFYGNCSKFEAAILLVDWLERHYVLFQDSELTVHEWFDIRLQGKKLLNV